MRPLPLASLRTLMIALTALLNACGGADSSGADLSESGIDGVGPNMNMNTGTDSTSTDDDGNGSDTDGPSPTNAGTDPDATMDPDDGTETTPIDVPTGDEMTGDMTDVPPDTTDMPPDTTDGMSCQSSGECSPDAPYCGDNGQCVECLGTPNCEGSSNPICNVESNTCVQCLENADCERDETPACDPLTHECVECVDDADCGDPSQACNPATNECVTACEGDAICGGDAPFCAMASGVCVECLVDEQCQDPTLACVDGTCSCGDGSMMCGDRCRDVQFDPDRCGGCDQQCGNAEMCIAGACECRIGLEPCGEACRDTNSDPRHCGGCDIACAEGEKCEAGGCQPLGDGCAQGLEECDGPDGTTACVNTDSDSLNCGDCGERCDRDEICAEGNCVEYAASLGCDADVCAERIDGGVCCQTGGIAMCVEDGRCPVLP